tara:strand:+ start:248 stop:412 length:165 start_codon:yes stop_codon:yes gene_type:complete
VVLETHPQQVLHKVKMVHLIQVLKQVQDLEVEAELELLDSQQVVTILVEMVVLV